MSNKITEKNTRYLDLLKRSGLGEKEALIVEALLENGEMGAGEIIRRVNLKRGDTYNHIYSLKNKGIIEESSTKGWKRFRLEHPSRIEEYIENRSKELEGAKKELSAVLPAILSTYNLSYHKPGVKVFEGEEAIERVMSDSLTSRTPIYEYLDPSEVDEILDKTNKKYVLKRLDAKIAKKLLVPNTTFSINRYKGRSNELTKIRFLDFEMAKFQTVMQIYDGKISYLTLSPDSVIGVIIEDPYIYKMHKTLFDVSWEAAKEL
ncbi:MAG: Sugar-specific transcriptional regulator TrmB [candidate division WS2 bacterium ADurb.Bin280]|uniref:Sugar-specific transcriptional regulator TrmB n=1 Tax=candidate division WS2 bacterium ADurb.Bin280 TaxID=1852829 RepID=A0A1V5SD75_9BACT|nr:MAG: Sugar-specific transcriptional regulator TrmB [candidate division WS2 bacterium ADurb.Bin280]